MSIFDLFSKRQKRLRGEDPDVYVYDQLPQQFRVQVVHIIRDMLGTPAVAHESDKRWAAHKFIVDALRREYGVFCLTKEKYGQDYPEELFKFFLAVDNVERALDVIELASNFANQFTRDFGYANSPSHSKKVDQALAELNLRFKEHGIGFQFVSGEIVRVDSELLHEEAVKPALKLMHGGGYAGPLEEFLRAHEHGRHGRHEAALTEALKAFESTMKAICDKKGWEYDKDATSKKLINTCLTNGLVDGFWQTHLSGLRAMLESGIPTVRNKLGGHGQGLEPRQIPRELVAYALHMTASTIVFFIESAKASHDAG